jgi:hypothetical protein
MTELARREKVARSGRVPSTVTAKYWIRAEAPVNVKRPGDRVGKWLLFTNLDGHDKVWEKIRAATEAGDLGCRAKAATARPNPLKGSSNALLTCVYTCDYQDLDDVQRVLAALRGLGFGGRLVYKTDEATMSGRYGPGSAIYVSQPGSQQFEIRD